MLSMMLIMMLSSMLIGMNVDNTGMLTLSCLSSASSH